MAIGLEDVSSNIKKNNEQSFSKSTRVLRPWEGYEKLGNQTRTIMAQEAVKKAKMIVMQNDLMADKLRKDRVSNVIIDKLEKNKQNKEKQFSLIQKELIIKKVKSRKNLLGFLKGLLRF